MLGAAMVNWEPWRDSAATISSGCQSAVAAALARSQAAIAARHASPSSTAGSRASALARNAVQRRRWLAVSGLASYAKSPFETPANTACNA